AFVDVRMAPGWDGIETVERIWAVEPAVQIVICTAFSDHSRDSMLAKLVRSDRLVLLKQPFDNIEALQLATALTERWRLVRQAELQLEDLGVQVRLRTRDIEAAMAQLRSAK